MELELLRSYFPEGTNGAIFYQSEHIVHTIELPWKDNHTGVSCIPEGRYRLIKQYNTRFGWHWMLLNVPAREGILIHPANDALQELRGCIAPVSIITGQGKGGQSRSALQLFNDFVSAADTSKEAIFLTIKILQHEHS